MDANEHKKAEIEFQKFIRAWRKADKANLGELGEPTMTEVWLHAWQAAKRDEASVREQW